MKKYKLDQVFGVSSEPVESYLERQWVDAKFKEAIASDKQVVVYGASKQGKTALVSRYLPYDSNVVVSLTPKTSLIDIYHSVLRQVGITLKAEAETTSNTKSSVGLSTKFKAIIPFMGSGEAEIKGNTEAGSGKKEIYEEVPINLALPQDVSEVLKKASKGSLTIILENFHYLDEERQKELSFDLRSYQELGIQFVILGVWKEKNRLAQFNGDLLDRVTEVPVEPWSEEDFNAVAERGSNLLNIRFSEELLRQTIQASFSSIGVFQELLKEICKADTVNETADNLKDIRSQNLLLEACTQKAEDYSARHQRALESIAVGNVSSTKKSGLQPLYLPYYLIKVILSQGFEGIGKGIKRNVVTESIQKIHHRPDDVRPSDMSNLLHNLAKTQASKSISPPLIDYDQSKRLLQVVDSTFYFFLKHSNLEEVSEEILDPIND